MEDLLRGELIGLNIRVINRNIKGRIIDETKNRFIIESNGKRKRVLKKIILLSLISIMKK